MSKVPRPSHADYTYLAKYNIKSSSGGGRSSARETIGRVGAGAVAEKWLKLKVPRDPPPLMWDSVPFAPLLISGHLLCSTVWRSWRG
jgi:hypothetical protein